MTENSSGRNIEARDVLTNATEDVAPVPTLTAESMAQLGYTKVDKSESTENISLRRHDGSIRGTRAAPVASCVSLEPTYRTGSEEMMCRAYLQSGSMQISH